MNPLHANPLPAVNKAVVLAVLLAVTTVIGAGAALSQERATTESGRIVLLHPDGTWEFVGPAASVPDAAAALGATSRPVYFGNLHAHTAYSDGMGTPEEAYRHARDVAGLDFLAITEHNHRQAQGLLAADESLYAGPGAGALVPTARRFTEDGRFVALYGQEFSSISSGNHANVLEVGALIRSADVPNGRWDRLLGAWLPAHPDSQGEPAVVLLNHPATYSGPDEYGRDDFADLAAWRSALDVHAQLINLINGPSHDQTRPGAPSWGEYLRYLNLGLHVAPTADQDNHRLNWGSAAETRTAVVADALTRPALLAALRNRHVYATEDRNLRVVATVNGALAGTRFQGAAVPAPGTELDIVVELFDDDEPFASYRVDVYADHVGGDAVAEVVPRASPLTREGNGTLRVDGVRYDGGEQYFFLRVTQTSDDAEDRAWIAPVWFEPAAVAPLPVGPLLALEVDRQREEAVVTNVGDGRVDLAGWTLVSVRGDQRFAFPGGVVLGPGEAVVVTSGPGARDEPPGDGRPRFVRWTRAYVWNDESDPGRLLDASGVVHVEVE